MFFPHVPGMRPVHTLWSWDLLSSNSNHPFCNQPPHPVVKHELAGSSIILTSFGADCYHSDLKDKAGCSWPGSCYFTTLLETACLWLSFPTTPSLLLQLRGWNASLDYPLLLFKDHFFLSQTLHDASNIAHSYFGLPEASAFLKTKSSVFYFSRASDQMGLKEK